MTVPRFSNRSLGAFVFFTPTLNRAGVGRYLPGLPACRHACRNRGAGFGWILVWVPNEPLVSAGSLDVASGILRASFLWFKCGSVPCRQTQY